MAGDFTGNGRIDLAVATGFDGTVSVLLGNGDGTFAPQVAYAMGSYLEGFEAGYLGDIAAGDFTGSGRIDLAVADYLGNTFSLLLSNADGTFSNT